MDERCTVGTMQISLTQSKDELHIIECARSVAALLILIWFQSKLLKLFIILFVYVI